jgi:hypothetical protein
MCSCHRHGDVGRRPVAVPHRPCTRRHAVPEGWSGISSRSKPARQWRPQRGAPEAAWGTPGMPFQQGALLARWHVPGPLVPCETHEPAEPCRQLRPRSAAACACWRLHAELYSCTTTTYHVRSSSQCVMVCICGSRRYMVHGTSTWYGKNVPVRARTVIIVREQIVFI